MFLSVCINAFTNVLLHFERTVCCAESMPKTDVTGGVGGYGTFQGHMSAHDLALNQATQQQGYNLVSLSYLRLVLRLLVHSWLSLVVGQLHD